jgi:antitoxin (DNA-binding transcriptional repressor) of toxin-antitoxin stability system
MMTIDVHELEAHIGEVLRRVREQGETVDVLDQGKVVVRLVPVQHPPPDPEASRRAWADLRELAAEISASLADEQTLESMDRLALEIGTHWPNGVSAVDAVREGRREL